MSNVRTLSPEGLAILEAVIEGAGSRLLSDSVLRALQETGLIQRHGEGWMITEDGLRSLDQARERMKSDPNIHHGIG